MKFIAKLFSAEKGATAIEYGLIAALIAVAAIASIRTIGTNLNSTFNTVATDLAPTAGGGGGEQPQGEQPTG